MSSGVLMGFIKFFISSITGDKYQISSFSSWGAYDDLFSSKVIEVPIFSNSECL